MLQLLSHAAKLQLQLLAASQLQIAAALLSALACWHVCMPNCTAVAAVLQLAANQLQHLAVKHQHQLQHLAANQHQHLVLKLLLQIAVASHAAWACSHVIVHARLLAARQLQLHAAKHQLQLHLLAVATKFWLKSDIEIQTVSGFRDRFSFCELRKSEDAFVLLPWTGDLP